MMNHIVSYSKFTEKYIFDPIDPPEITSQKTESNKIESMFREYSVKKVTIDNIYLTYTDEKDLISKLVSQKLIEGNPNNVKTIVFKNPLLSIHAQISRKLREIRNIEDLIKSDTKSIQDKKLLGRTNASVKTSVDQDIIDINDKISSNKTQIQKLNNDIITLKRAIDTDLAKMKKDIIDHQRRISTYSTDKLSKSEKI